MAGEAKTAGKKKEGQRVRKLDGKVVRPVYYNGRSVGENSMMAGEVDGKLVTGPDGKVLPLSQVGELCA